MATGKIALNIWLGLAIALWSLYPLFYTQARGVQLLAALTGVLAVWGWLNAIAAPVFWSALTGLINATLALVLTSHPPNLWAGLGGGIAAFRPLRRPSALDVRAGTANSNPASSSPWSSRSCRISALSIVVGLAIGVFLLALNALPWQASSVGVLDHWRSGALRRGLYPLFATRQPPARRLTCMAKPKGRSA